MTAYISSDFAKMLEEQEKTNAILNSGLIAKNLKEGQVLRHSGDAYNSGYDVVFVYCTSYDFEYMKLDTFETVTLNLKKGKLPFNFSISNTEMNEEQKAEFEDLF